MFQEGADQFGIQLLQLQRRGRYLESPGGKLKQQLETVSVGVAGMLTGSSMKAQMVAQKRLDVGCDGGHGCPPRIKFSAALAMSRSSSGVASRYQYVASML